jgi:hypothetical protein
MTDDIGGANTILRFQIGGFIFFNREFGASLECRIVNVE